MALQDSLRRELRRRIAAGDLTGMLLARKTGFTQAHISNFLNGKRGLKLRALDRMLKALGLTLYDLLDARELARHAALPAPSGGEFSEIPVVDASAMMSLVIVREQAREILHFRRGFLDRLRSACSSARKDWTRFVVFQTETNEASAIWPEISGRATLLVDRHYTSLDAYRPGRRNIYAIGHDSRVLVRYAEITGGSLVLQPGNPAVPAIVLPADTWPEAVIGRVAQVSQKI